MSSRFLESKTKFSFANHRATGSAKPVTEDVFSKWSNNNFYRTSYHDMYTKVRFEIKNLLQLTSNIHSHYFISFFIRLLKLSKMLSFQAMLGMFLKSRLTISS